MSSPLTAAGAKMAAGTKFVQRVTNAFMQNRGHDSVTMQNLKIIKAKPGMVWASMKIEQHNGG